MEIEPEKQVFSKFDVIQNIHTGRLFKIIAIDKTGSIVNQLIQQGPEFFTDPNGERRFFVKEDEYDNYYLFSRANSDSSYNPN